MGKVRYAAYAYTIDSDNKVVGLKHKELKTEHMARNFVSYWNTVPKVLAFLCLHTYQTDTFGQHVGLTSKEID